jgi:hypothetical protein
MCGPYKHRKKIDALLLWVMTQRLCRDLTDANRLTEFGLAALREQYGDLCSEDCMRERAATFAENLIRGRSKGTARPNGPECEDRRVAAYGSSVGSSR